MMKPGSYYFNGIKATNINNLPEDAWEIIQGEYQGASGGVYLEYKKGGYFRRAVDIRGLALSNLPRDIMRNGEKISEEDLPNELPFLNNLNTRLFQIEVAMILFSQAYLLKQDTPASRVRKTPPMPPRWLKPMSVKPIYNNSHGLVGFNRKLKDNQPETKLNPDEVIYFWTPTINADIGPGDAEGEAALDAAGVLRSATTFNKNFFDRGAVYPTLLSVDGNPSREEMDKLKIWWRQMIRGVKTAWESVAIRAAVKPEIIGPSPEQMALRDMTDIQRETVATTLGVPHSIVMSNAANFAVSQQDYINLYELAVIPRAELVEDIVNEQWFGELGLRLVFQPKRLDVFQQRNLKDANVLTDLVDRDILDINEAREVLGYQPREIKPKQNVNDDEPVLVQLPRVPESQDENIKALRRIDLEKWQRKSLSAFKSNGSAAASFDSEVIDSAEAFEILNQLSLCFSEAEVKAVFSECSTTSH